MDSRRGRFISVEGGEGCGKSLLVRALGEALRARGLEVICTREPGGTPVGDALRQLFAAPPGGETLTIAAEACLVAAGRSQHVHGLIKPALARGAWVVSDRFADSTRVYQGKLGGIDPAVIETLVALATDGVEPDLTLVLDCDVDLAQTRMRQRGADPITAVARYDQAQKGFHQQLRAAFLELAIVFPERVAVVDAAAAPDAVFAAAWRRVEARFGPL